MVLLDTDHISLLMRGNDEGIRLRGRLKALSPGERVVSIVSFEEQTRGWLSVMASAKMAHALIDAYAHLERHLEFYCAMPVISFDARAAIEFQRLREFHLRVGTMDLRIAAIALAQDALLLTRNTSDFSRVPDLRFEDWTA